MKILHTAIACISLGLAMQQSARGQETENEIFWNQFRGPNGDGLAVAKGLAVEFSETKNVRWATAIHDKGWSSPVVWDKQIWLTTAKEDGRELFALCVDLETGKIIHDIKVFDVEQPQLEWPDNNSHATPTPIVEEGRVYVHFGAYGTACLETASGKKLWERRDLKCDHRVRPASSPIIDGDLLFLTFDGVDAQFIVALDKKNGHTKWRQDRKVNSDFGAVLRAGGVKDVEAVKREKANDNRKSYATPNVISHGGRRQLVSPAAEVTISYDPETGEELWRVRHEGWGWNVTSRPIYAHGRVYLTTGISKHLLAVDPSGTGDVTDTHVVWNVNRGVSHIPSPLIVGDLIYLINDSGGMVSCLDAKTGREIWKERLGGFQNHWASPSYADGKIYFFSRNGKVSVISAKGEFQLLAHNELDSGFFAGPAFARNAMILRSQTHLYHIARGYERTPQQVAATKSKFSKKRVTRKGGNKFNLEELAAKLKAEVAAGRMTEEDAKAKYRHAVGVEKIGKKNAGSK